MYREWIGISQILYFNAVIFLDNAYNYYFQILVTIIDMTIIINDMDLLQQYIKCIT